jgi:AcrR family transcriptional regulator
VTGIQKEAGLTTAALLARRRPRRADAARNFDAIVCAAREEFTQRGLHSPLDCIARRAGVGTATLYRHFPTRKSLIEAVYAADIDQVCQCADELYSERISLSPGRALTAWLAHVFACMNAEQALAESLISEWSAYEIFRTAISSAGQPLLKAARESGAVRADVDVDDIVRLIASVAVGVYLDDSQRKRVFGLAIEAICSVCES